METFTSKVLSPLPNWNDPFHNPPLQSAKNMHKLHRIRRSAGLQVERQHAKIAKTPRMHEGFSLALFGPGYQSLHGVAGDS